MKVSERAYEFWLFVFGEIYSVKVNSHIDDKNDKLIREIDFQCDFMS